jgi:hypothetical protein
MQFRKNKQKKFAFLVLVQLAIYMLFRFSLITIFKNNPGGLLEFHLYEHAIAYSRQPVNTILLFGAFIIVFILGMGSSTDDSNFVRNSLFAIGVPSLVLYFFFGVPFEVRIFLETYPSIFLSICYAAIFLINRYANPQQ